MALTTNLLDTPSASAVAHAAGGEGPDDPLSALPEEALINMLCWLNHREARPGQPLFQEYSADSAMITGYGNCYLNGPIHSIEPAQTSDPIKKRIKKPTVSAAILPVDCTLSAYLKERFRGPPQSFDLRGKTLYSGDSDGIKAWDLETGTCTKKFPSSNAGKFDFVGDTLCRAIAEATSRPASITRWTRRSICRT